MLLTLKEYKEETKALTFKNGKKSIVKSDSIRYVYGMRVLN
jgi:hypothetical protein